MTRPAWGRSGGFKVLTSAILTPSFSQTGSLLIALTWFAAATATATVVFRRNLRIAVRVTPGQPLQP